jgi:pimeloyl-ACP methyl ester carboxylesterase
MARLILVHGAFVGAWKWGRLVQPLEEAGHSVETLDLPGSGQDPTPIAEVSLDAYVDRVRAQLDRRPEAAVLVASSMGGVVATQTAARDSEQVGAIVYVSGFVPTDGKSLLDLTRLPEGAEDEIQANIAVEGDPPVATMPEEASRSAAYGECSAQEAAWAIAQHRPQALQPFTQPVRIPAGALDGVPRAYVSCTRDRSVRPALQRRMIAENRISEVIEIDSDHSPMVSRPQELATAVDRLLARMLEPQEVAS